MKKLMIAVLALVGFSFAGTAQTTAPTVKKEKVKMETARKVTMQKKDAKVATVATTAKPAVKTAAAPLKKDGTLDKRFTANKAAATTVVKKDGTPDMRYKENKKKKS
ncbi:MAG: hypothetical protein ABJB11_04710 [Ferruginibacter sp.]